MADIVRHCLVTWGAKDGFDAFTGADHQRMKQGLAGYAYVEAFPGAYVVILTPGDVRDELVEALRANLAGQRTQLLVSPEIPIGGQRYNGALPRERWDAINQRITA